MKKAFGLAGRLALIVALTVALLSAVNYVTSDVISAREEAEGQEARSSLLDGSFSALDPSVIPSEYAKTVTAVYEAKKDGALIGYCMDVTVNGFGGSLTMIVGMNADLTVTGVRVLSHSETPGIGSKAVDETGVLMNGLRSVSAKNLDNVATVSGATVTSKAVLGGVRAATEVGSVLREEGSK